MIVPTATANYDHCLKQMNPHTRTQHKAPSNRPLGALRIAATGEEPKKIAQPVRSVCTLPYISMTKVTAVKQCNRVKVRRVFRRVASSIHVALIDERDQGTKVNPSRSDGSGVLCVTIRAFLKLGRSVGHTGQFGP